MESANVKQLVYKQEELAGRIARSFDNFKKKGAAFMNPVNAKLRIEMLRDIWAQFSDNHDRLISQTTDKERQELSYFREGVSLDVEESYLEQAARFRELVESPEAKVSSETTKGVTTQPQLHRMEIPVFKGDYLEWSSFKDLFASLVIDNQSLSDVQRLHYLKTSVRGEAERLIRSIPVSNENFAKAWEVLQQKYENKRAIVSHYLNYLLSIKAMASETAAELGRVLNATVDVVGALELIGRPVHHWDDFLVHLTLLRLDPVTRKDWEVQTASQESVTFAECRIFIQARIRALELTSAIKPRLKPEPASQPKRVHAATLAEPKSELRNPIKSGHQPREHKRRSSSTRDNQNKQVCSFCAKEHFLAFCDEFQAQSGPSKLGFISEKKLCINCLGQHNLKQCLSRRTCKICFTRHHTLIHDAMGTPSLDPPSASTHLGQTNHARILGTAAINVRDQYGQESTIRALIDTGSEVSLMSESLAQHLRLPRAAGTIAIMGIGSSSAVSTKGKAKLHFRSRINPDIAYQINALIVPAITKYRPHKPPQLESWAARENIALADTNLSPQLPIEVLLGVDIYPHILLSDIRKTPSQSIVAQNTTLGWILLGSSSQATAHQEVTTALGIVSIDQQLHEAVRKFWEQEEVRTSVPLSPDDIACENHFKATHRRLSDGRYEVRLPFKLDPSYLGQSRGHAETMLRRLEHRFDRDPHFKTAYHDFIQEYAALDHMEALPEHERAAYVLPHHGVLKEASTTTKLRVVFNASAKTSSGYSLNDLLHTGPQVLPALDDILIRWRLHRICFSADIEKMYRGIRLNRLDRRYQTILWREDASQPIHSYQLTTVTYGMACSPFLAIRTLHQLAEDDHDRYPLGSAALRRDTYVDDILSGADTMATALRMQAELLQLPGGAGLNLRKWTSNQRGLIAHLEPKLIEQSFQLDWTPSQFSILGLLWDATADCFHVRHQAQRADEAVSKRTILKHIAQLFDPLGFIGPIIATAKLIMQSLWISGVGWDDPVPSDIHDQWSSFQSELHYLADITIPRWTGYKPNKPQELHVFADASERAYGTVAYWLSTHNGRRSTTLVAAKTKLAPIKPITLPRLELCAASLATQLAVKIKAASQIDNLNISLWSDSTIVLSWIKSHPTRWKTYVANRVSHIQTALPDAQWRHVPSEQNPADMASRGTLPSQLIGNKLWWEGPSWLRQSKEAWPNQPHHHQPSGDPATTEELKVSTHAVNIEVGKSGDHLINRFSNFNKLIRITATCMRFANRARRRTSTVASQLTPQELSDARNRLIKYTQQMAFAEEIHSLRDSLPISTKSKCLKLAPFLDDHGLLRVGGRLKHSLLDFSEKHPIILPPKSPLTLLIIRHAHLRTLHGGLQLTLAAIRQEYWILAGRRAVKTVIYSCTTCRRHQATPLHQKMGDLPTQRITPSRPFLHTGVDYAGPILIKTSKLRNAKVHKCYIALFICFSTKAIHLELVSDYTTDACLAALQRFISRRGICMTITSDRGSNFVGAASELHRHMAQAVRQDPQLKQFLLTNRIQWLFGPPGAPHFGGLWEAAVKSTKHHLRRTIGEARFTFEELTTLLCQIEAILNSRPLQPIQDDPDDLAVLTPGHFLVGSALNALPEPDYQAQPAGLLRRWKTIQQMRDSFWHHWKTQYLQQLQARQKWRTPQPAIAVGDLVLIKHEKCPPCTWPLARVTHLHPGRDGLVRVVTVKTATATLQRPILKLVLLVKTADENNY